MPKAHSPAIRIEALELRRAGWTLQAIAASLDLCPQVIGQWAKRAGIPSRGPGRLKGVSTKPKPPPTILMDGLELAQVWRGTPEHWRAEA
jgi:hypothetical protein